MTSEPLIPWADVMRIGLGTLRFAPQTFWAMTPKEFAAAVQGLAGTSRRTSAPDRQSLLQLMQQYPDRTSHD